MITIIGEAFDPLGYSWNLHKTNTADLRSRQEGPIPLTLDHDEIAGEVLTLTRIKGGAVYATAVTYGDHCDGFLELVDTPIYFSPATDTRARDGGDGRVIELALTFHTARVAARPVELHKGDIRNRSDRGRWALRGLAGEIVPRAAEEIRCRPKGGPLHIRDLEQQKWLERENQRSHTTYIPQSFSSSVDERGTPIPPQMRSGWKPGDLEWSQAGGKVLRVS